VDQTSAPTPAAVPQQAPNAGETPNAGEAPNAGRTPIAAQKPDNGQTPDTGQAPNAVPQEPPPGFRTRGRARRRARFLRKARELAYRDLGGLVFDLHRFGQRNDPLVLAKLSTLTQLDTELRQLEGALKERQAITVLREAGVTACPRCAAIHSGEDRFCPHCGLSMSRHVDLPIAGTSASSTGAGDSAPGAAATPTAPSPAQVLVPSPAPAAPAAPSGSSGAAPGIVTGRSQLSGPAPPSGPPFAPSTPAPAAAPGPAPAPAPAPAPPTTPATAPAGRSPKAPPAAPPGMPTGPRAPQPPPETSGDDEPTEIIRPPSVDR
jgi:hypothetical protein